MPATLRSTLVLATAVALATAVLVATEVRAAGGARPTARADLALADGTHVGAARFFDRREHTLVRVAVRLPPDRTAVQAFHGFHVHANDNPANGQGCVADPAASPATWFTSADGHLKAATEQHAHHAGDMPALLLNADGSASAAFTTDRIAPSQLVGRAVILHADADNFGNVPTGTAATEYTPNSQAGVDATLATGNAGARLACGVVR